MKHINVLFLAGVVAILFLASPILGAAGGENKAMYATLLQMTQDHKMHERYYTVRDLRWAAELRSASMRLQTVSERLARISQKEMDEKAKGIRPTLEENAPLTIGQMKLINHRDVVPYIAILWYGNGKEPPEFYEMKRQLKGMMFELRGTADMLYGYMNKHLASDESSMITPNRNALDALLWRTRLTVGLFTVATYYKQAGETIAQALKTFEQAPVAGKDLVDKSNRTRSVVMLATTANLLNEAARYMGMAGTELGNDEERWQKAEGALNAILSGR